VKYKRRKTWIRKKRKRKNIKAKRKEKRKKKPKNIVTLVDRYFFFQVTMQTLSKNGNDQIFNLPKAMYATKWKRDVGHIVNRMRGAILLFFFLDEMLRSIKRHTQVQVQIQGIREGQSPIPRYTYFRSHNELIHALLCYQYGAHA
jgi:hypothetical protein